MVWSYWVAISKDSINMYILYVVSKLASKNLNTWSEVIISTLDLHTLIEVGGIYIVGKGTKKLLNRLIENLYHM